MISLNIEKTLGFISKENVFSVSDLSRPAVQQRGTAHLQEEL